MELLDCFTFLSDTIHSVVISTASAGGLPEARVIDIMGCDESGLYFSTGAGKSFYEQLVRDPNLVVTGMAGASTMERVAVSVHGEACEVHDPALEQRLFDANPYYYDLYPTEESRKSVRFFCVHRGVLDWYDLSKKPLERLTFAFGGAAAATTASRSAMLGRLARMLVAELGLDGQVELPADEGELAETVDRLLAEHAETPFSADLVEMVELYRAR